MQRARAAYERAAKAKSRASKPRAAAARAETRLSRARAETTQREETLRAALEKSAPVTAPIAGTVGVSRLTAGGEARAGAALFLITPTR